MPRLTPQCVPDLLLRLPQRAETCDQAGEALWGGAEWTDLDQAYLDAWGYHPDLSALGATVATMSRRNVTVHEYAHRPDVLVQVDGQWVRGEVRMQWQEGDDDAWWVQVQYSDGQGSRKIGRFPADQGRPDTTDRSRERAGGVR